MELQKTRLCFTKLKPFQHPILVNLHNWRFCNQNPSHIKWFRWQVKFFQTNQHWLNQLTNQIKFHYFHLNKCLNRTHKRTLYILSYTIIQILMPASQVISKALRPRLTNVSACKSKRTTFQCTRIHSPILCRLIRISHWRNSKILACQISLCNNNKSNNSIKSKICQLFNTVQNNKQLFSQSSKLEYQQHLPSINRHNNWKKSNSFRSKLHLHKIIRPVLINLQRSIKTLI